LVPLVGLVGRRCRQALAVVLRAVLQALVLLVLMKDCKGRPRVLLLVRLCRLD
jgi:hypothetical protein